MTHQHDPDVSIYAYRAMNARHAMIDSLGLFYRDDPNGCLDAPGFTPAGSTIRLEFNLFGKDQVIASPLKNWRS